MGKAFPQLQTLQDFNSSCKNDWRITIFLIVSGKLNNKGESKNHNLLPTLLEPFYGVQKRLLKVWHGETTLLNSEK